jgi:REP element-mobilizing transposase RayT
VINRGIAKRPLFEDRSDMRFFLSQLARQVRLGRLEVHAFSLLTTHYHLLLRSPVGELGDGMRCVQSAASRRFNRRRKRDGSLTRGRYYSKRVGSLRYRRTLVRYIDANPVKAGIVRSSANYEFGSSAAYSRRSGPIWLERSWIEAEVAQASSTGEFSLGGYVATFGHGDSAQLRELSQYVEARIASTAEEDPGEDLIGLVPARTLAWMQSKARLADGHRVGLPVCGHQALACALQRDAAEGGPWLVEDGKDIWRGDELARIGLLRDLCGATWQEVSRETGSPASRVRRLAADHQRLMIESSTYAQRAALVGHRAIRSQAPGC